MSPTRYFAGAAAALCACLLASCGAKSDTTAGAGEVAVEPVADRPAPTAPSASGSPAAAQSLVAGPVTPGETLRGNAVSSGTQQRAGQTLGGVSDRSRDVMQVYAPFTPELAPGRYRLSTLAALECDGPADCQSVIRIRPTTNDMATFRIINAFFNADGTAGEATGALDSFSVQGAGDGVSRVELDFTLGAGDGGTYRVIVMPATAVGGDYDAGLTGTLLLGDMQLARLD